MKTFTPPAFLSSVTYEIWRTKFVWARNSYGSCVYPPLDWQFSHFFSSLYNCNGSFWVFRNVIWKETLTPQKLVFIIPVHSFPPPFFELRVFSATTSWPCLFSWCMYKGISFRDDSVFIPLFYVLPSPLGFFFIIKFQPLNSAIKKRKNVRYLFIKPAAVQYQKHSGKFSARRTLHAHNEADGRTKTDRESHCKVPVETLESPLQTG